ncbi:MAG: tetratricopeptide repeat protein, partial [Chloroflexota bacterium]
VLSLLQRILTPSDNTQTASISMPLETPAIRESYLQAATFVGRETEMTQLQCALAKAKEGAGSAWLVGGESGVGKSRLLQEVRTHALVNGFLVLTGQANENGDSFYELWRTPLRQLLLTLPQISDLDAGVLMPIIPDIADLLGREIPSAPPLDGEAAQTRLFVTITQLLTETPQPVLLMLEDLHWATASLLPLPYLTRALTDTTDPSSLVVIGSYRDDERPELAQTLADMQPLHLKRLTEDNMADLAAAMLGELGQRPDIVQRLQQETEGNAFFAVEVLRTLAEDMGGLTHIGDAPLPDMLLPDGIQSIVQRRLARVPQEDQPLLQLAAVAGRTLDMSLLQTLNGGQEIAERWLHTCAEVAMLEVVDDSWQFQHAKMRDGLLAMIPAEIVKQHHQQVAEAIEQVYPDDPRYAAQLMVHWRQAENPEKEFTYAYQAGTHAASQYANEDAIMYLTQAYELNLLADWIHDKQYMQRQYDVLLAREEIYALIGQRDPQKTDLALLAALADTLGQPSYQAEVALRHGEYADSIADYAASHDYAQIAIDKAQCANNTPILTKAYRLMGDACFAVGEHERAETALEQALTLVDHTANAIEKGKILNSLGEIAQKKSAYRQAMTYYQQSLHIYTTISDEQGQAQTLRILGGLMRLWGNEQEGLAYSEKSLEIFERIGDKTGEGTVTCNIGGHWSALGAFDTANAFYQRSLMVYQQIGDKSGMSVTLMGLAFTARIQEQVEEAYQYYRQGLQINQELGDRYVQAAALVNLGNIWRNQTGVFEQAKAHLEQSIAISHQLEVVDLEAYGLVSLGALFNQLGYYQKAQSYLEDILITFREIERRDQERETLHNLCNSLIAQRMFERAKQTLQEAVDISRELGYAWIWVGTGLNHLGWIAYQEGEYEQMLAYYEEAQTTLEAGTSSYGPAMSLAGIAWAKCLLGYTVVASDILSSLAYIENNRICLDETTPFRLHLICYKLLEAIDDPFADVLLTIAHEQIQQIASYIETPEWRESFLTNVPEQRALEQCYRAFINQS